MRILSLAAGLFGLGLIWTLTVTACDDGTDTDDGSGGETASSSGTGGSTSGTGGSTSGTGGSTSSSGTPANGFTADHTAVDAFDSIPVEHINSAADFHIYYGHTSHGSQLVSGTAELGPPTVFNNLTETGGDLGSADWDTTTDTFLQGHPETEVVIWSWCGQLSSYTPAQVEEYLSKMSALEANFPGVNFVYMTGHLRGSCGEYEYEDAENQVVQTNNAAIRAHAAANDSWFFDFADIESYQEGSTEQCMYHDMPVECTWPDTPTCGCAHSMCANCVRKAKALWWLLARMDGWDPT